MTEPMTDKPTILVVDDSRLMRVAARKILKNDFEVLEAEDGEIAWEMLQGDAHISLVMSDLSMPNLDGLGLLRQVRQSPNPGISTLPVIIVTGAEDDDGSKQSALSAGASDFITKPFDSVQLLARSKAQARQQRTQQALHDSQLKTQRLEEHSNLDQLTGLANDRAFFEHLEEGLSYAIRHRTELAVLMLQVDRYKVLFLRRGKEAAESALVQLAGILRAGRRREDIVARVGLDSFAILLPCSNPVGARRVAEQLRAAIEAHTFQGTAGSFSVTASVAVSSPFIHPDIKPGELLDDAAEKLKIAQQGGGNRVVHRPAETASEVEVESPEDMCTAAAAGDATVASSADVQRALEALAAGHQPEGCMSALVRATVPLLEAWNRQQDNRHAALIEHLKASFKPEQPQQPAAGYLSGPAHNLQSR